MTKRRENEFNFTESRIKKLKPADKRLYFSDIGCPNLWIQITPVGTKTFQAKGWSKKHQKPSHETLGKFPDINLELARELCTKFNGALAEGHDLDSKRREKRMEINCETMFDLWLKDYGSKLRAGQESYDTLQRYCKPFFKKKIGTVNPDFVQSWYNKLLTQKKQRGEGTISAGTANRCLINLRACLNIYLPPGVPNPCEGIKKGETGQGERFLDGEDLQKFLKSLEDERKDWGDDAADFFLCCLLTGARSGNIKTMRWKDIYDGIWQISAKDSKSKKVMGIALSNDVQVILERRRLAQHSNDIVTPWVFPNPRTKSGHIEQQKRQWQRIMNRAGLPHTSYTKGYRVHDLRHSLGSHLALAGCSLPEIQQALGHKDAQSTARYMHLSPDKSVMEKAAKRMKVQAEKVVNIGGGE